MVVGQGALHRQKRKCASERRAAEDAADEGWVPPGERRKEGRKEDDREPHSQPAPNRAVTKFRLNFLPISIRFYPLPFLVFNL